MNAITFNMLPRIAILTVLLLSVLPVTTARALDMTGMVIDSISAHPEVKEKIHVFRQVLSDRDIAESGWRPSVDLEASTGVYDTESPLTGNESEDYDSNRVELSVTQNLFNGYDTTYQVEQTKAQMEAALFDVYDSADNIALRAIQSYLEVIKQRRLYQLAVENVAAHEEILAQIKDRNLSGVGRRSELQQTEGRLARAQASLIAQQNNLEDSATQLHQILGRYIDPQTLVEPNLPIVPGENLDLLIERALIEHPAMRVAESNIAAAQSNHRRSLKTRYPNVDLRLATEYGNDIGGLSGDTEETSLVLNFTYNFYRGGRNSAEQQKKISEVYEQKEFLARVRRQIINTLRLSWTADDLLQRQIKFLNAHVIKSGQTVVSYREEFFIGQRDLLDLLDAENELNNAKNQYTEASIDAMGARYRVYEGIGALFPAANVDFELDYGGLKVARLTTDKVDQLPLPEDEDQDQKVDPLDQCDNSLGGSTVNPFGCLEIVPVLINPEIVSFKGNREPTLTDDEFEVEANGMLIITTEQLLANDSDADSDRLEVVDVSQPEVGRLAFNQDDDLIYRPTEGFTGLDSFKYTATDNNGAAATATATVNIKVRTPETIDLAKTQLVNFDYDAAELTEISKSKVDLIIERIKLTQNLSIEIYTYTDNIGSDGFNLRLSARRAKALENLLISNGISPGNITARGMGEENPIADNSTAAGQAINRRGEFIFKAKQPTE